MTTYNVADAKHATLGVATEDIVNLSVYSKSVQIMHRGAVTNPIYVTYGAIAADAAGVRGAPAATVAGDNAKAVFAGTAMNPLVINWPGNQNTACIRLICATGEPYTVQGINEPFGS